MKQQSAATIKPSGTHPLNSLGAGEITTAFKNTEDFKNFFQQYPLPNLDDLLMKLAAPAGKNKKARPETGLRQCSYLSKVVRRITKENFRIQPDYDRGQGF